MLKELLKCRQKNNFAQSFMGFFARVFKDINCTFEFVAQKASLNIHEIQNKGYFQSVSPLGYQLSHKLIASVIYLRM